MLKYPFYRQFNRGIQVLSNFFEGFDVASIDKDNCLDWVWNKPVMKQWN